ncbi:MAG: hypothetical protein DSY31_01585, partial [Alphaproteobacteria bacterium]
VDTRDMYDYNTGVYSQSHIGRVARLVTDIELGDLNSDGNLEIVVGWLDYRGNQGLGSNGKNLYLLEKDGDLDKWNIVQLVHHSIPPKNSHDV